MNLKFTKMNGLGNDFMVIDGVNQKVTLQPEDIARLARRDTGVGFDQCLLIEPGLSKEIDFFYRIFNADGQEVGQCGNGARCLALFAKHYGLTTKTKLKVATVTTCMELVIHQDDTVSVDFGIPNFAPQLIPLKADKEADSYLIQCPGQDSVRVHSMSIGNPHAVLKVEDVEAAPVAELGRIISLHPDFPEQANAGFMQILSKNHLKLRVYERGCGETRACGSGAVAAAVIGRRFYHMDAEIKVSLPGGDLHVTWPGLGSSVSMRGPAEFVYEGELLSCTS